MWTTVPFDPRTLPSHFKAACFRGGPAEGPRGLQKPAAHFRLHVLLVSWRALAVMRWYAWMQGKRGELQGAVWKRNSLACTPGPTSDQGGRCASGAEFWRLVLSLWCAGISNKLTQELKLGQEKMPNYVPAWGREIRETGVSNPQAGRDASALGPSFHQSLPAHDGNHHSHTCHRNKSMHWQSTSTMTTVTPPSSCWQAGYEGELTKQHEEQRADNRGHNDQQCEPDTLPHLSRTPDSTSSVRRGRSTSWKRASGSRLATGLKSVERRERQQQTPGVETQSGG